MTSLTRKIANLFDTCKSNHIRTYAKEKFDWGSVNGLRSEYEKQNDLFGLLPISLSKSD